MKTFLVFLLILFGLICYCAHQRVIQMISYATDEASTIDAESIVQITMTIDGNMLSASDPIEVKISIHNLTDRKIFWGSGSSSCIFHLLIVDDQKEYYAYFPRACTADYIQFYLRPRESRTSILKWSGKVSERGTRHIKRLQPGSYDMIGAAGRFRSAPIAFTIDGE